MLTVSSRGSALGRRSALLPRRHSRQRPCGSADKGSKLAKLGLVLAVAFVCSLPAVSDSAVLAAQLTVVPFVEHAWWTAALFPMVVGATTGAAYHYHALAIDRQCEALWATPEGRARTKVQPRRDISPELRAEAVRLGNLNACLTGLLGSGLFVIHVRVYPWALARTEALGFASFLRDAAVSYLWIDFSAYWLHRALHTRSLYWLHKSHHRYQVPIAHAAFAAHPVDFVVFQLLGMLVLAATPLHPLAFIFAAAPTAYHNQIEHCGLLYTGEMPWSPTPAFHDDHHSLYERRHRPCSLLSLSLPSPEPPPASLCRYTCNFGFEWVLWDWAFGTLRQQRKAYREDTHHDRW